MNSTFLVFLDANECNIYAIVYMYVDKYTG